MVSPTRLTDKLVFLGLDLKDSDEYQLDWNFGLKGGRHEPRYCLRFEKDPRSLQVCVSRKYPPTHSNPTGRYWNWNTPARRHADLLFAMLPPEEVARVTAFTLGVAYGQP